MTAKREPNRDQITYIIGNDTAVHVTPRSEMSLGSGQENDLILQDEQIASCHAVIALNGDGYKVIDQDSESGTFIDDERLTPGVPYIWSPKQALRLGNSCYFYLKLNVQEPVTKANTITVLDYNLEQLTRLAPGRVGIGELTIINRGEENTLAEINVIGVPTNWIKLNPDLDKIISLEPQQEQTVKLTISPPNASDSKAGFYDLRIEIIDQSRSEQAIILEERIVVMPTQAFRCCLHPSETTGVTDGLFRVEIHNEGNTELQINLAAQSAEDLCEYVFDPPLLDIPAGQHQFANLSVLPRVTPSMDGGRAYHFFVTAKATNGHSEQAQGVWRQISPNFDLELKHPRKRESAETGSFEVSLTNYSEIELTFTLEGQDDSGQCQYHFEPTLITIQPEQEIEVNLTVQSIEPLRGFNARTQPFEVTARLAEAPYFEQIDRGEWTQLPTPIRWRLIMPLVGVLFLLLIIGVNQMLDSGREPVTLTPVDPPHIRTFSATPNIFVASQSTLVTLTYYITGTVNMVDIYQDGTLQFSDLSATGTLPVSIDRTTQFTLVASGPGGSSQQQLSVILITPLPTKTPVSVANLVPEPTDTPTATSTPVPTSTPSLQPTDTPVPTPISLAYDFVVEEVFTDFTSNPFLTGYIATISADRRPLAGIKAVGIFHPDGERYETSLSTSQWEGTSVSTEPDQLVKYASVKFERGGIKKGSWVIHLENEKGERLSADVFIPTDPENREWFAITFKQRKLETEQ